MARPRDAERARHAQTGLGRDGRFTGTRATTRLADTGTRAQATPDGAAQRQFWASERSRRATGDTPTRNNNRNRHTRGGGTALDRAHDAEERRNHGTHTPPTTHSAALPTHPPSQAPRPSCIARVLAVRGARRVRARDVEVSSSTAHPIGEPTGAHPRVRAYGGGAAQRRLWGVRDRSRKQLSVCLPLDERTRLIPVCLTLRPV